MRIARGDLKETRYFLIPGRDLNFVDRGEFEKLGSQCDVVGRQLGALSKSLREKLPA